MNKSFKKRRKTKVEHEINEPADPPSGKELEMIIMRDGFKYFVQE